MGCLLYKDKMEVKMGRSDNDNDDKYFLYIAYIYRYAFILYII